MTAVLTIEALHKSFGDNHVLRGIDLEIAEGERIAILGASGSGKSTLLRCLNFLEMPSAGRIAFRGAAVGEQAGARVRYREAALVALRRRIGMVFQQFNLFPHMIALENVMEGPLSVLGRRRAEAEIAARARLDRVGLAEKADAYPSQLSGGQQQRVAIARALAMEPEVMLFDEPTSSLDPELVGEVLRTIKALGEDGGTMLLVTHEVGFAFHFATRVLFLQDGRILEDGPPEQVLKTPREDRTRTFLVSPASRNSISMNRFRVPNSESGTRNHFLPFVFNVERNVRLRGTPDRGKRRIGQTIGDQGRIGTPSTRIVAAEREIAFVRHQHLRRRPSRIGAIA